MLLESVMDAAVVENEVATYWTRSHLNFLAQAVSTLARNRKALASDVALK